MSRRAYDYYPTPRAAFAPLAGVLPWSRWRTALEPSAGDGRLSLFLQAQGLQVSECELRRGLDFFDHRRRYDLVFGNPPYRDAERFAHHALELAPSVLFLLRLGFLASRKRAALFAAHPPDTLITLSARPSFTGDGKTDASDYAWIGWGVGLGLKWI